MSFAKKGNVEIVINIPASEAIRLALGILSNLKAIGEAQEQLVEEGSGLDLYDQDGEGNMEATILLSRLRLPVAEGVTLNILPDQRTPRQSGYGFFSVPEK